MRLASREIATNALHKQESSVVELKRPCAPGCCALHVNYQIAVEDKDMNSTIEAMQVRWSAPSGHFLRKKRRVNSQIAVEDRDNKDTNSANEAMQATRCQLIPRAHVNRGQRHGELR